MIALKRLLHFTSQDGNGEPKVFDQLVSDLRVSIVQRLALDSDELNGWPEGRWAAGAMEAKVSHWQDDGQHSLRLTELDWSESVAGCTWRLKLNLASSDAGPVTMEETWWVDTTRRALPFEDLPTITQFAGRLEPVNRDGLPAAKTLVLGADRLNAFREYLLSPARTLPVVVFSPRINGEERALATELAHHLMGAAVVLRWSTSLAVASDQPAGTEATILLSRQAQAAYRALDEDERDYWARQLFPKLLQSDLRNNQTRKMKSKGAPCFVYPRKRTADGLRVIFYCDESNVFVCEVFTGAQHDSDYDRLNTTGVDQEAYDGFVVLSETSGNAAR